MELKIAILVPRSDMFPTLARDVLNGLKLGLDGNHSEPAPKFLVEGVGNATDDGLIRTVEKMLLQEEVDLTISFCSLYILGELVGVFKAYKKPLIHMDLGGNALKREHISPFVVYHSLNLWQSAYAAGVYAAKNLGKNGAMTASFYDGGYQHSEGFVRGYTESGGTIVHYYVGPKDYKSECFDNMIEGIKASEPDVVFTLFSFKEGNKVWKALANSELNGRIPFMAIPSMTDEINNTEDHKIDNVVSVASWAFDDERPEMTLFVKALEETYGDAPNIMSLLGYEVGLVLTQVLNGNQGIPKNIAEILRDRTFSTPRGTLGYNLYGESQTDTFKIRKFNFNGTSYHNTVIGSMETSFMEDLYDKLEELPYVGWQNPYICT